MRIWFHRVCFVIVQIAFLPIESNSRFNHELSLRCFNVGVGDSQTVEIGHGVRQGSLLSPLLFSINAEMMMIETMEDLEEGVRVGGELLRDFKFANDQEMVAQTEKRPQTKIDAPSKTG